MITPLILLNAPLTPLPRTLFTHFANSFYTRCLLRFLVAGLAARGSVFVFVAGFVFVPGVFVDGADFVAAGETGEDVAGGGGAVVDLAGGA